MFVDNDQLKPRELDKQIANAEICTRLLGKEERKRKEKTRRCYSMPMHILKRTSRISRTTTDIGIHWKARDPVRSPLVKPMIGGLVVKCWAAPRSNKKYTKTATTARAVPRRGTATSSSRSIRPTTRACGWCNGRRRPATRCGRRATSCTTASARAPRPLPDLRAATRPPGQRRPRAARHAPSRAHESRHRLEVGLCRGQLPAPHQRVPQRHKRLRRPW